MGKGKSIEDLESWRWPPPEENSTSLVRAVYELRKKPVESLSGDEMARLIGQNVGVVHLLGPAISLLEGELNEEASGGFFDEELLTALLSCRESVWQGNPESALRLRGVVSGLSYVSKYLQSDIDDFLSVFDKLN